MTWSKLVAASLIAAAISVPAQAQQNELIVIGNATAADSQFYMLSYRRALSGDIGSGLRFRFDATHSSYATNYDATPGTGNVATYRALLSYVNQASSNTTLTYTGGLSYRTKSVSPSTLNSPADFAEAGYFVSFELYNSSASQNDFLAMIEYDSVFGTTYAAMSYEFKMGSVKVGPTANYITEGNYARSALGISASFGLTDNMDIKATGAWAEQTVGGGAAEDVSYFELQIRTTF